MFRRSSGLSAGKYPVPALSLNYAITGTLSGIETFTRASSAWAYDAAGVLTQVGTNIARFDCDPATLALRGLLIEEQRQNLLLRSGQVHTSPWAYNTANPTVTGNVSGIVTPDGTTTATQIVFPAGAWQQSIVVVNDSAAYTASIFVKAGSAPSVQWFLRFNGGTSTIYQYNYTFGAAAQVRTGTTDAMSTSVTSVGNGWYRLTITAANNSSGNTTCEFRLSRGLSASTSHSAYYWGAQLEIGSFPTSYIPTTSATATRAADVCTVPISALGYSASEGTLFAEYANSLNTTGNVVYLSGTGTDMRISRLDAATSRFLVRNGSPLVVQADLSVAQTANPVRVAAAWANNDFRLAAAGFLSAADTSGTVPVLTSFAIGSTGGSGWLNGCIRRIAFYSRRLDNAILGRMTS